MVKRDMHGLWMAKLDERNDNPLEQYELPAKISQVS